MKLAEALAERSDCQKRIEDLKGRIVRGARIQEGEQPAEDPLKLLVEVEEGSARLLYLIQAINRTNSSTPFEGAATISDAIARRDVVGKRRDVLGEIVEAASTRQDRYSKSEVKFVAAVPVGDLQKQKDQLSKEYREIDTRIQELNWKTEVI